MLRNEKQYTRAIDVYSFGIMLAEIWNQRVPFNDEDFDSVVGLFHRPRKTHTREHPFLSHTPCTHSICHADCQRTAPHRWEGLSTRTAGFDGTLLERLAQSKTQLQQSGPRTRNPVPKLDGVCKARHCPRPAIPPLTTFPSFTSNSTFLSSNRSLQFFCVIRAVVVVFCVSVHVFNVLWSHVNSPRLFLSLEFNKNLVQFLLNLFKCCFLSVTHTQAISHNGWW